MKKSRLRGIGYKFSSAHVEVWIQWDIQDETKSSRRLTVVLESSWGWRYTVETILEAKVVGKYRTLIKGSMREGSATGRKLCCVNFFNPNPFLLVMSAQETLEK